MNLIFKEIETKETLLSVVSVTIPNKSDCVSIEGKLYEVLQKIYSYEKEKVIIFCKIH